MPCAESNARVQAYFDGELDAVAAAEVEQHIERCTECRALLTDLEQMRTALRRDVTYERTPSALRARIVRALDAENAGGKPHASAPRIPMWRVRPFWAGAAGGVGGAALAAGIAFLAFTLPAGNTLLDGLVSAHVRSLMPMHLIDVESSDRHTVKPWFAGHADVSPVVVDFAQQGYRLIGGRADYFDHQRAAVVVYQHGPHVINVFSWAAQSPASLPSAATRNGYHVACWKTGDLAYCAVSDTGWDELQTLERLLRQASMQ
jgi:anti-sigma factor (TIGR02949 family)